MLTMSIKVYCVYTVVNIKPIWTKTCFFVFLYIYKGKL